MAAEAEAAITQGALRYGTTTRCKLCRSNCKSREIYNGGQPHEPILQCVQLKPLAATANNVERYRVVFSDVRNWIQAMLGTRA